MKNFPVKVDGKEYWISRSVATVCFIFKRKNNKTFVLIEKRGKGAADNIGKWCVPGGYLEWDITLAENAALEVLQETGFVIKKDKLKIVGINSSPSENHQNVTVRYIYNADTDEEFNTKNAVGGEKDEVEDVQWLDITNINNKFLNDNTKWAFKHNILIKKYLKIE